MKAWPLLLGFGLLLPVQAQVCEKPILNPVESVRLLGTVELSVKARVDTGADYSSLDSDLAQQVGLDQKVVGEVNVRNSHGISRRKVVRIRFVLKGLVRTADFTLIPRRGLGHQVLLGRQSIKGFLVDPAGPCSGC
jgi:hypothetical protein